jgi:hypothetical protein
VESSLRAFLLLMLFLTAGVAGVSSSTRLTASRPRAPRFQTTDFHVACGPSHHFVFAPWRNATSATLPPSSPTQPRAATPQPTHVRCVDTSPPAEASRTTDTRPSADAAAKANASPTPRRDEAATPSTADDLAGKTITMRSTGEGSTSETASSAEPALRDTPAVGVLRVSQRPSGGHAGELQALSCDLITTWEIDPDESQVALVTSLCRACAGGTCRATARSCPTVAPVTSVCEARVGRPIRNQYQNLGFILSKRVPAAVFGGQLGGRPSGSRWWAGWRVTWTQFCNWFENNYLLHESASVLQAESAEGSDTLSTEEYTQLLDAIRASTCALSP